MFLQSQKLNQTKEIMEIIQNISDWFQNVLDLSFGEKLGAIISVLLLLIIGLWLAGVIRRLIQKGLHKLKLDERVNKNGGEVKLEKGLSKLVYYFLVIYVLMLVLQKLGLNEVLNPLDSMMSQFFDAIPNIIVAGIIAYAGWMLAKLVSEGAGTLIEGANNFSKKLGLDTSKVNLAKIIRQVLFIFIFVPILIVAIQKLGMEAISEPATAMLHKFVSAIPNIIAAGIIIGVFYLVAKFIQPALRDLLVNLKFDEIPERMGMKFLGNRSLSNIISNVVFFFIMLAGLTSGLEKLEMNVLIDAMDKVMAISGKIFFGLIILTLGNFVASIAYNAMSANKDNAGLASIARIAILGIFFGMGLNAMGIADSIVNLAFGLTLGAVAVAVALSFGLGGREAAGKQMEHILKRFRKD